MPKTRRLQGARPISGLGPHGEFAAAIDQLVLTQEAVSRAANAHFYVALVLHTTESDWSKLQIAGIHATLAGYGAELVEVVECGFQPDRQSEVLGGLLRSKPDAIISVPVGVVQVSDAHRRIASAGIKLVLMDNAPTGMLANRDYVSVVSADNFGNGEVAAELLADHIPPNGRLAVIGFNLNFYVTNERELGFRKWLRDRRPDIEVIRLRFAQPDQAGQTALELVETEAVDGLFVVWDEPAMEVIGALRSANFDLPVSTVDLGRAAALELARGGMIKGVGAQLAYDQGIAEATVAIMALTGQEPPAWVALPAVAVTAGNVVEAYEAVWHERAPQELHAALVERSARG